MRDLYTAVHIQLRKYVLDHADYTAPTQQHGLDRTDQEYTVSPLKDQDHEMGFDDLCVRCVD